MTSWVAEWHRIEGGWHLTVTGNDGAVWLAQGFGMADPDAGPPVHLLAPESGWLPFGAGPWRDEGGVWSHAVAPVSPAAEAIMRAQLGLEQ